VLLKPLTGEDSRALLDELGAGLDSDARARVIQASEGNPLFLEEMVALARERGTVEVPPTIQALLTARLERLGTEERELLERGAVEGEVFHRLAVRALAGERLAAEVELRLAGLVRKELIRPHPSTFQGDDAFRFRHLLIRDAAYDTLPKAVRADLHERFAIWLEEHGADLVELDEIAGWHLEQAVRYRRELGQEVAESLAGLAAKHLYAAGRRAAARSDVAAAANLLDRALALTPDDALLRPRIAVELAEQRAQAGDFAAAEELYRLAEPDPEVGSLAVLGRLEMMIFTHPSEALQEAGGRLEELLEDLTRAGNEHGIAKAHLLACQREMMFSQARLAAQEARLTAVHAARAGDEALKARALGWYVSELVWGPEHADTIAAELDELEPQNQGPFIEAFRDLGGAEVARLRGDFDLALDGSRRGVGQLESLGIRTMACAGALHIARVGISWGKPQIAVEALLAADGVLDELGERSFRSTVQALLGWSYALLGDHPAARAACDLADQLGAPEDLINFVILPAAQARIARAEGDLDRAEELARAAVGHAERTDNTPINVLAHMELARVLAALGRGDDAAAQGRRTLALNESKGDRTGVAEAQSFLDRL
jgi:tetratricopeptide (TPR) repeat protein